ncbi:MAG: hypothetical protein F4Y04_05280 [Chloroflexi bacterium]|nr:hypothetical protein [Chloroflexota bacterium]
MTFAEVREATGLNAAEVMALRADAKITEAPGAPMRFPTLAVRTIQSDAATAALDTALEAMEGALVACAKLAALDKRIGHTSEAANVTHTLRTARDHLARSRARARLR